MNSAHVPCYSPHRGIITFNIKKGENTIRGYYKKLSVYQDALNLVDMSYAMIQNFPKWEWNNLSDQLRRASTSIALNIAEGNGRQSTRDYVHFLRISLGSINEIEAIAEIAIRQNFISDTVYRQFTGNLGKIRWKLIRLIKSLQINER